MAEGEARPGGGRGDVGGGGGRRPAAGPGAGNAGAPPHPRGLTTDELIAALGALGITAHQARQIMNRLVFEGRDDLNGIRGLPRVKREAVEAALTLPLPRLTLLEVVTSPTDGFTRYLFETLDGHRVESVEIPLTGGAASVCLSSQVGCALGCVFCETGRLGFKRDLESWEMVDQLLQVRARSPLRITGAVFMGQGEPMLNYDAVIRAATILREPNGGRIRAESITISTAGILPGVRRFIEEGHRFRLILSLTSADPAQRRALMPIEGRYPAAELVEALRGYAARRRTRITVAWVAIKGVNTGPEDVARLKALLEGLPVRLNLIEVNDPSGRFQPPGPEELSALRDALRELDAPVVRRYTGGKDVRAACGLLASTHEGIPGPTRRKAAPLT